jgi:hypothetical protein
LVLLQVVLAILPLSQQQILVQLLLLSTIIVTPSIHGGSVSCNGPTQTFTITVNPTPTVNQQANQVVCNKLLQPQLIFLVQVQHHTLGPIVTHQLVLLQVVLAILPLSQQHMLARLLLLQHYCNSSIHGRSS